MSHVIDDLELYVLGALPPEAGRAVADHLAGCDGCRREADALEAAVMALQDALPAHDPSPALRDRILASAAAPQPGDLVIVPARTGPITLRRASLPTYALAAAAIAFAVLSIGALRQVDTLRTEIDESRTIGLRVSQPAKTWYMSGVDRWQGAGGMLYAPQSSPAFVVFRDLGPAPAGQSYTIWLVDAEGRWIRGSSFGSGGGRVQMVDVGVPVEGFDRCAVTLETRSEGARQGPIVMQSRFYTQP